MRAAVVVSAKGEAVGIVQKAPGIVGDGPRMTCQSARIRSASPALHSVMRIATIVTKRSRTTFSSSPSVFAP